MERIDTTLKGSLGLGTKDLVSLAGAGGKTTLMFSLARELCHEGRKVVTTTTTKILGPAPGETNFLFVDEDEEKVKEFVRRRIDEYRHITLASRKIEAGKLKGVSPGLINELWDSNEVDFLIVEADGAAGRAVKAPREHEPVIPSKTTLVVAILGVDGVGAELNETNVFQPEGVSKMTGVPIGARMTEEAMAVLMTHAGGIFKGAPSSCRVVVLLNKVDLPNGIAKARGVAQKILGRGHPQVERVILGQLKNFPPVVEVILNEPN